MRQMSDIELLVNYAAYQHAVAASEMELPATVSIVGNLTDAIGSADSYGDDDVDNMTFLINYLGYPCDAAYIVVCLPSRGVEVQSVDAIPDVSHIRPDDAIVVESLVVWGCCIPTREVTGLMVVKSVTDEGAVQWIQVDPLPGVIDFPDFVEAAHTYDGDRLHDNEAEGRALALSLIQENNGAGFVLTTFDSGLMLRAAKAWEQTNVLEHEGEAE